MNNRYSRKYPKSSIPVARKLRRELTPAERKLWSLLRRNQLGTNFRKQVPIGSFIVDFFSTDTKLIVELDGSQHLSRDQAERDQMRDGYLKRLGFSVIRFHNNDILKGPEAVCRIIQEIIQSRLPDQI
jgi:very-short-patch-repair endonuclease